MRSIFGLLMQRLGSRARPFGLLTPFAEIVTALAHYQGVRVILFSPADVEMAQERIAAWRYRGSRTGWVEEEHGLPDVLWNRYFRKDEMELLQWFKAKGIPLINEGSWDKWESYRFLSMASEPIRSSLPVTELLTEAKVAMEMASEFPEIFIKPVAGSVGRGIIRGRFESPGILCLQYVPTTGSTWRQIYATKEQLDEWLARTGRSGRFIVQQGLDLAVFSGRNADVRVLIQKDGAGCWGITGMGARIAAEGRFTTNLHTGGQGVHAEKLAKAIFPDEIERQERLILDLGELALAVANRLEERAGSLGELGLDFGVDQLGKIWIIEQNGQPGRSIFSQLERPDLTQLAHLRPIEYAQHLASTKSAAAAGIEAT